MSQSTHPILETNTSSSWCSLPASKQSASRSGHSSLPVSATRPLIQPQSNMDIAPPLLAHHHQTMGIGRPDQYFDEQILDLNPKYVEHMEHVMSTVVWPPSNLLLSQTYLQESQLPPSISSSSVSTPYTISMPQGQSPTVVEPCEDDEFHYYRRQSEPLIGYGGYQLTQSVVTSPEPCPVMANSMNPPLSHHSTPVHGHLTPIHPTSNHQSKPFYISHPNQFSNNNNNNNNNDDDDNNQLGSHMTHPEDPLSPISHRSSSPAASAIYYDPDHLRRQSLSQPAVSSSSPQTEKKYQCHVCGRFFRRDLPRHLRTHQEVARFLCPYPRAHCPHKRGQFNRPYDFKKHLLHGHFVFDDQKTVRSFRDLRSKLAYPGTCVCGMRFRAGEWLDQHVLGGDRPCPFLEKAIQGM
jgi:hypothetical protein